MLGYLQIFRFFLNYRPQPMLLLSFQDQVL